MLGRKMLVELVQTTAIVFNSKYKYSVPRSENNNNKQTNCVI